MVKRVIVSLVLCLSLSLCGTVFALPTAVHAQTVPTADNWVYPVGAWNISTHQGDEVGTGYYHMGIDVGFEMGAGAEVYAMADGVVREAQERSQFGLVVLIESTLGDGSRVVSLYGHLRPSDVRVTIGQEIHAGDVIGVLGDSSENGGWSPHLHVGIHKGEYTGVWVYYGHVSNPDTANDWYSPETFAPEHLVADSWNPEAVFSDLTESQIIGDDVSTTILATDIGSGVQTLRIRASDDGQRSWSTIEENAIDQRYENTTYFSLADFDDGVVFVRVVAIDAYGHKGKATIQLSKKADAPITVHIAAVSGAGRPTQVSTTYQAGELNALFYPYTTKLTAGGDIDVGFLKGEDNSLHIVTVKNGTTKAVVKLLTKDGTELNRFTAFTETMTDGARIAAGDVDGDGVDEIIVGTGAGVNARVRVFDRHGELLTELQPFVQELTTGVDVAAGDVDGDGVDEIIVGARSGARPKVAVLEYDGTRVEVFRAFGKKYLGGVNVATGDVDGDGMDEIIVGTGGDHIGKARVFDAAGKRSDIIYTPFGETFTGAVDVSSVDWEEDGTDEVMVSQASDGEAWVKTYRFDAAETVVTMERLFEEGFMGGARVAGWH